MREIFIGMAVRKLKLIQEEWPDIDMIGINTSMQDYRLAYFINKETFVKLERLDDLPVYNEKLKELTRQCLYKYYDGDKRVTYYLISNDNSRGKMIDQYSQANFFLLIKGNKKAYDINTLQSVVRKLQNVTFVFVAVISKIKDINGIMQDLELHEINLNAKVKQA